MGRRLSLATVVTLTAFLGLAGARIADPAAVAAATSAPAVSCPTVSQASGAVTPAPSPGVDWSGCDLDNAIMVNADLAGANLSGASLTGGSRQEDLSGTNLTGANLSHAEMSGANMTGANLTNANMTGTTLSAAVLAGVRISGAILTGADLTNVASGTGGITGSPAALPPNWAITSGFLIGPTANLVFADLHGLNLSGADLASAVMSSANLTASDLSGANVTSADLSNTDLSSANLTSANLTGAYLTQAKFGGADLGGAMLSGATLASVSSGGITGTPASLPTNWTLTDGYLLGPQDLLAGANLANVDLTGADLAGANLTGADLSGANLASVVLTNATLASANLSGTNLATTTLTLVHSGGITGSPILPANWVAKFGFLIGPRTYLAGANLSGDDLSGVDLDAAFLPTANLASANLSGASVVGANFGAADLTSANFSGTDLTSSLLFRATISGTNLGSAVLDKVRSGMLTGSPASLPAGWLLSAGYLVGPGANLISANLSGANLADTDLSGTNLVDANLTGTDLAGANLSNADLDFGTLDGTDLKDATVTGATFTDATWLNATCPDGTNSNKYVAGCFSAPDTTPPAAAPTVTGGTPGTNGWYTSKVSVSWNWTDNGTIVQSNCQQTSTTTTLGTVTLQATCADLAGNVGHAHYPVKVDTTRPAVSVTRVAKGARYVIGGVPAAGCATREQISGVAVGATVRITTAGADGVGAFTATCGGATSVAGTTQAAPVSATYTVVYGFGGFIGLKPGSEIAASARTMTVRFRLTNAAGRSIPASAAAALAARHAIEVTLTGPKIRRATAQCRWNGTGRHFACALRIPKGVRLGRRYRYKLTAQENLGTGFVAAPEIGHATNPLIIHFTSHR